MLKQLVLYLSQIFCILMMLFALIGGIQWFYEDIETFIFGIVFAIFFGLLAYWSNREYRKVLKNQVMKMRDTDNSQGSEEQESIIVGTYNLYQASANLVTHSNRISIVASISSVVLAIFGLIFITLNENYFDLLFGLALLIVGLILLLLSRYVKYWVEFLKIRVQPISNYIQEELNELVE